MAIGERTPLAALDAPASGRMAVGEAITNLLAAPIELRAGQAQLQLDGRVQRRSRATTRALYDTVRAVAIELCPALGISVPVGKDSLSMRTRWRDPSGAARQVTAPVSLIVSSFATLADVRPASTPQLVPRRHDPDPGRPRRRPHALGGIDAGAGAGPVRRRRARPRRPGAAARAGRGGQPLREAGLVLAYHDRSDGGLWATVCEMAFAGHLGVALNVDLLVTESDGIGDSRAEFGDAKNWATQVSGRRDELTLRALFNEELGAVIQVPTARRDEAMQVLRAPA